MITYNIQHTRANRYIVRQGPREMAQFATEAEAKAEAARLAQVAEAEAQAMLARIESDHAFNATVPALNARQVAFQTAMHRAYDRLTFESRRLTRQEAKLAGLAGNTSPSMGAHLYWHERETTKHTEDWAIYDAAARILRRCAEARQSRDIAALEQALVEADGMITQLESIHI